MARTVPELTNRTKLRRHLLQEHDADHRKLVGVNSRDMIRAHHALHRAGRMRIAGAGQGHRHAGTGGI